MRVTWLEQHGTSYHEAVYLPSFSSDRAYRDACRPPPVPRPSGAQTLDPLVAIANHTIFGGCSADQVAKQPGTALANSPIEPFIAADPKRPGVLLTGVQQDRWTNGGSRGLRGGVSGDGGKHWYLSLPSGISQCTGGVFPRATDPWVTYGPDGAAYFFSLAFVELVDPNANGRSAMLVSKSTDAGLTWGRPTTLIDDTDPLFFNDKNSITADPYRPGYVYAVWDRLAGPPSAFVAPGGSDENASSANAARAAIAHDGLARARAHLAKNRANAANAAVPAVPDTFGPTYYSRTTDGGKTWERASPIYDPGQGAQTIGNLIQVLPNGDVLDFFTNIDAAGNLDIGYVRSTDKGFSFERTQHVVATMNGYGAITPDAKTPIRDASILFSVSTNRVSGKVVVTWQDTRLDPTNVLNRVFYTESNDAAATFSTPVRIDKTPANAATPLRTQAFNPTIVAADDGTLAVTYYDFRHDTSAAGQELADTWAIFCKPTATASCTNAASWGHELRLTPKSFNLADAPLVTAGLFLGDYFGLATQGKSIWPAFVTATGKQQTTLWTRRIALP